MFGRQSRLSKGTPTTRQKASACVESSPSMSKATGRTPAKPSAANTVSPMLRYPQNTMSGPGKGPPRGRVGLWNACLHLAVSLSYDRELFLDQVSTKCVSITGAKVAEA